MAAKKKALRRNEACVCELLEPRLLLSTTLVDFGDVAGNNSFGTSWTTVYKGPYTDYVDAGPDGITGANTGRYHCAGISGAAARQFNSGDQVTVTWYNNNASSKTFTPTISFDDLDYDGTGDTGTWYTMSQMTIPAGQSATATFTFDGTSQGSYYNVTTARSTDTITGILIDKIEVIVNTTVSIAATDSAAAEPSNTGTYTVTRTGGTTGALTVNYTVSGTATNGTDYSSLSGSVTIPDGQASATITVTPTDDSADEASETVIVTLASGSGYAIGSPSSDTVNLADDDPTITSLVNLGDSAGNNTFGTSWTTVYLGTYTGYDAAGPDGTMAGYTGTTNAVRVSGSTNRSFAVGDQVVATWYNNSGSQITFTPKVSFTDTNEWDSSSTWYNMNQVTIAAYGTATTTYTVDAGSAGDRALVNVCRYTAGVNAALLDKIELYTNDAPASPSVTISATDASAAEPSDTGTYTVTRSGGTSGALAVNYTISGTATNGTDYSTLGGTVTIPDGQANATITLTPTDDGSIESTETAILTLATGSGYTIGSPNAATVNLADNDVYVVTISATDASAAEPSSTGTYTVTRSGGTSGALAVNYTVSGTATNGTDYSTLNGTVTIPDGQASETITLTPTNDNTVESTETAILTLASGTGYSIGSPSAATVNIADNDFVLTVNNGDGDGTYDSGSGSHAISAATAPAGYVFDVWTGDTAGIADIYDDMTTFTMPASNATIFATYIPSSGVVVSTVTGTATTGSTLTISGVNFGTKATAAPVKYDTFESGTSGNNLSGWSLMSSGGTMPKYSGTITHGGSLAGLANMQTQYNCTAYAADLNLTTAYVSYWVYVDHTSGVVSRNIKLTRLTTTADGDPVHGSPSVGYTSLSTSGTWYYNSGSGGTTVYSTYVSEGSWHRVELYGKISTYNVADGSVGTWLDGAATIPLNNSSVTYGTGANDSCYDNVILPFYVAHDDSGGNPVSTAYNIYYDDVYIDSSLARVEIGNAPTWSECTQREVQPASSWSNGSIQITANLSAFTGNTVYVYVVDANNNVNAAGYEITIGQTSSANRAPAVDAGTNQSIQISGQATLDGTAADDGLPSSPGNMTYTWSKVAGTGNVTFGNASAIDTTATFSAVGEYNLKLSVTDGNQTRVDYVTVLVKDANNRIPVVNLGDSAANNTFGFINWNTVTIGSYVGYSASGPDGTKGGSTGGYDIVAVKGATHTYAVGDKVVATWYNDSASQITFTPMVSFNDPDAQNGGTSGTWYNMSQVTIPAYGTVTATYTVDANSAGTYSLLNVCRGSNTTSAALLDKFELELT